MTPIPFDLPRRTLPPTVAYAAGLVCEHRPDLADGVRAAVLGDNAVAALDSMASTSARAADGQGINALNLLRGIVHYGGNDPKGLHALADVLYDSFEWRPRLHPEHADLVLPLMYFRRGFAPCWEHAKTPNDLRCLRRLITLHAHTVSLDATVRAAWAQAHLNALNPPVRPQSPDRLT